MKITKRLLNKLIKSAIKENRYAVSPSGIARKFDVNDPSFNPNPSYKLIKKLGRLGMPHVYYTAEEALQKYFGVSDISQLKTDAEKIEAQGVLDAIEKGRVASQSAERKQRTGKPTVDVSPKAIFPDGNPYQIPKTGKALKKSMLKKRMGYPQVSFTKPDPSPFSVKSMQRRAEEREALGDASLKFDFENLETEYAREESVFDITLNVNEERIYNQLLKSNQYQEIKDGVVEEALHSNDLNESLFIDDLVDINNNSFASSGEDGFFEAIMMRYPKVIKALIMRAADDLMEEGVLLWYPGCHEYSEGFRPAYAFEPPEYEEM